MKIYEITAVIKDKGTKAKLNFDVIFLVETKEEAVDCFNRHYYGDKKKYEVKDFKIESYNLIAIEKCDVTLFKNKIDTRQ